MRRLMVGVLLLGLLPACDYTVALVSTPQIDIDRGVIGLWNQGGEEGRKLLVLPLDAKECVIQYRTGEDESMFGRLCIARAGDLELAQIRWIGSGGGELPDDERVYQYGTFTLEGDTLRFRPLNSEVVSKDVTTPETLLNAIDAAKEASNLFREEVSFSRVRD